MAKIYNILRYVDDIKPNRFTDETKVQWLNEVEGYIQTEVMMLALADVVQYDPEVNMNTDLLVKFPHDKLYSLYLCAMVDFANGEYDKYTNTMQLYNEFLGEYIGWYTLHFRPADGGCVEEGYYLTAYQLAVIRGFEGTLDEWLESLNGATAYDDAAAHGYTGSREDFGRDQAGFAANAAQVRLDREAVERAASGAESSAESASAAAGVAAGSASAAEQAAGDAESSKRAAAQSAESAAGSAASAGRFADAASSAAADAVEAKNGAEEAEARTKTLADEAEQTVKDTLQEAKAFVVEYGKTKFADIVSAIEAEQTVMLSNSGYHAPLVLYDCDIIQFTFIRGDLVTSYSVYDDDTWYTRETRLARDEEGVPEADYNGNDDGKVLTVVGNKFGWAEPSGGGAEVPTKTSELENDSGFITKAVSDLLNYYAKSQTYTQAEVNALVSAIPKFAISVVSALPTSGISATTVYLVKSGSGGDLYTEYIYVNGAWEILGSQRVDLTGYATEAWVGQQIADFLTADKLTAAMVTGALGYTPADEKDVEQISQQIADLKENGSGATIDENAAVHKAVGATYPPAQKPAATEFDGYDIDILDSTADVVYTYIDNVVSGKETVTKEILGKDASGQYDIARYIYAKREYCAWVRENYPKMYAWKNGSAVMYTTSVSPRIGDRAYAVPYVETSGVTTTVIPAKACILEGYRYSQSGGNFSALSGCFTIVLPLPKNITTQPVITLVGMKQNVNYSNIYAGETNTLFPSTVNKSVNADKTVFTITTEIDILKNYSYLAFMVVSTGTDKQILVDGVEMAFEITTDTSAVGGIATQETTQITTTEEGGTPVTAVSATNRSRTIGGVEYVRHTDGDVMPTVIYTAVDDNRNNGATITDGGITYYRYPIGDLGANREKLIPVFIYANEHGVIKDIVANETHEGKTPSLVAARLLRDMASGVQAKNPLYQYIRDNCMLIVIPVANPYGFNHNLTDDINHTNADKTSGYYNVNYVNINRNYDTPGWDVFKAANPTAATGTYPGSEVETQYIMNTIVESGAVAAMSLHGYASANSQCAYQGQNPGDVVYNADKIAKINTFLQSNWGYKLVDYDSEPLMNTPDKTAKSPSYITQCGAYGGIVEITPDDNRTDGLKQEANQHVCENAYAQVLNLTAMWLSDYLES